MGYQFPCNRTRYVISGSAFGRIANESQDETEAYI